MNYKKKYKEALELARKFREHLLEINDEGYAEEIESIFPELKESEDEKIRKTLIEMFSNIGKKDWRDIPTEKIIAWLKKQGEQKSIPNDDNYIVNGFDAAVDILQKTLGKVEGYQTDDGILEHKSAIGAIKKLYKQRSLIKPKFNIGDWIISNGITYRVDKIVQGYYRITSLDGFYYNPSWNIDDTARLWTLKDARDGDVLVDNKRPFIFKGFLDSQHPNHPVAYCGINTLGSFISGSGSNWWTNNKDDVKPATKEERELLFQEIEKAGYEWNKTTKELKKKSS